MSRAYMCLHGMYTVDGGALAHAYVRTGVLCAMVVLQRAHIPTPTYQVAPYPVVQASVKPGDTGRAAASRAPSRWPPETKTV